MTKEASYQIDCACEMNLCQNFGRAMARPVPPGLLIPVTPLAYRVPRTASSYQVYGKKKYTDVTPLQFYCVARTTAASYQVYGNILTCIPIPAFHCILCTCNT